MHYVPCVGHWQNIYRVSYKTIVHIVYVCPVVYSRFTLIIDNTDSLLESRDFVDQQMVADIIGHHTGKHHQHSIIDIPLSSSDFEQVRTYVYI